MYNREIEETKRDLAALRTGSGFYIDKENYESLLSDSEKMNNEVLSREESITRLEQHLEELEERRRTEEERWDELMRSFEFIKIKKQEYQKKVTKEKVLVKAKKKFVNLAAGFGKDGYSENKLLTEALGSAYGDVMKFQNDIGVS